MFEAGGCQPKRDADIGNCPSIFAGPAAAIVSDLQVGAEFNDKAGAEYCRNGAARKNVEFEREAVRIVAGYSQRRKRIGDAVEGIVQTEVLGNKHQDGVGSPKADLVIITNAGADEVAIPIIFECCAVIRNDAVFVVQA